MHRDRRPRQSRLALLAAMVLAAGLLSGCEAGATSSAAGPAASPAPAAPAVDPTLAASTPSVAATPVASSAAAAKSPRPMTADALTAALDDLRAAQLAPGALALIEQGATTTAAASGTRSIGGAAVTVNDRFRIGSITKPILAALVLISADRGELGLDEIVSDRLPGVLRPTPAITVRQLLAHTSGVFDELNEGDLAADAHRLTDASLRREAEDILARYAKGERVVAPDRLMVALAETHQRYFAPGTGYHYSNTNYQLLGMLLHEATGRTIGELLRTRIVEPLGLKATTLAPEDRTSPVLRGYDTTTTGRMTDVTDDLAAYGNGGNGGVVTTAHELLAILRAIVTGRLFPANLVAEMERPVRELYGLGLGTSPLTCGTFYGHGGSVSGTQSIALISPDGATGVVISVNIVAGGDPGLPGLANAAVCEG